jgi:hypothetical protein
MSFSIKHLLLIIALLALGLVALANSDRRLVIEAVQVSMIAIFVLTSYGIWISYGATRAFRSGFLVWASLYFLFHCLVSVEHLDLRTSRLLGPFLTVFHPNVYTYDSQGTRTGVHGTIMRQYYFVGHSLLALAFGLIGGWVTVYFYRKRQRMPDAT